MAAGTRPTAVPVYLGQLVQFGSITSSVQFFDMELPSGYTRFQLWMSGFTVTAPDPGDQIGAALRIAGNFANDPINADTYLDITLTTAFPLMFFTGQQTSIAKSAVARAGCLVDIYPGDLLNLPFIAVNYAWSANTGGLGADGQSIWVVNPGATIPPTPGPATLLRVLPFGLGNCNPPTSGNTIDTGDWRLYAYN